jgi:hypothetical protein
MRIKCKWCGLDFRPNRPWQKFCCADHQQRFHRWPAEPAMEDEQAAGRPMTEEALSASLSK